MTMPWHFMYYPDEVTQTKGSAWLVLKDSRLRRATAADVEVDVTSLVLGDESGQLAPESHDGSVWI